MTAGKLRNDCFALPPGVTWTPVDEALDRLRRALGPVTEGEDCPLDAAAGRVLATAAKALRSNPPQANCAVDGYGFALSALFGAGPHRLPLLPGRAAAGAPFGGAVPAGHAVRILTGAILPEGVDTVVLQEDTSLDADHLVFDGQPRHGANCRKAGEDFLAGDMVLPAGRRLQPQDLALLSAAGLGSVSARRSLRIGVLSTGDELLPAGVAAEPHQIYDANRPMLLDLVARWGFEPVDLGCAVDDPMKVQAALDDGADRADAILTSGGASAGDEDHVSASLRAAGNLHTWRIAVKPGRPLALGLWQGVPVFGLPGNPVAAFVCALIFARPALAVMAGEAWREPLALTVPAAFSKTKKAGRREFLRARLSPAGVEVFASEGSGRISGLSWADGLVELPDAAASVTPGQPVRYLPFAGLGV